MLAGHHGLKCAAAPAHGGGRLSLDEIHHRQSDLTEGLGERMGDGPEQVPGDLQLSPGAVCGSPIEMQEAQRHPNKALRDPIGHVPVLHQRMTQVLLSITEVSQVQLQTPKVVGGGSRDELVAHPETPLQGPLQVTPGLFLSPLHEAAQGSHLAPGARLFPGVPDPASDGASRLVAPLSLIEARRGFVCHAHGG